ncbi:MAG: hypothetical protein K6A33_05995 [Clostridiales bacterium]|nr:hypothetical protein [Clostridiales bacterium]
MKIGKSITMKRCTALLLALLCAGCAGGGALTTESSGTGPWIAGCAYAEIPLPDEGPFYIAGYHNGWEITEVRDLQRATALWLEAGDCRTAIVSVDCVGLGSDTVARIRDALGDLTAETGCTVHVVATHDHAGLDTLGLWGPVAEDGKNPAFMDNLVAACRDAVLRAYEDRRAGKLYASDTEMEGMYRDSRDPQIWDPMLHQVRFVPDDGGAGIRVISCGAHAESLRGANTRLSRDYPGVLCDLVGERTGDRALFLPGAVGGLIMTKEFIDPFDAEENLLVTGEKLAQIASGPCEEVELAPSFSDASVAFSVPLDNTTFLYYKFLGILGNEAKPGAGETGYELGTSLSVLRLGTKTLLLIPGEIFPELVFGGGRGDMAAHPERENPEPLGEILASHGLDDFFVVGLADDELGYIVPPDDFLVDERAPYLEAAKPADGSRHYEETNSVGRGCADAIANALRELLKSISE